MVALAVLAGVAGAFVHATRWHIGGVSLPLGLLVAVGGGVAVMVLARGWARARWGLALVFLAWMAPTVALSQQTAAGDVVVAADTAGLVFLGGATLVGAVGIGLPLRSMSSSQTSS